MKLIRWSRRLEFILFILVLSSSLFAVAQENAPANDPAVAALKKDIPVLMKDADIPGLSVAVIRNGKTYWTQGFGVKNVTTGDPVTPETIFNAASLSKPVFAYGVLKLVDAGKLKLDEPLAPYLPKETTQGDPRFQQITARLVLTHRGGFPNWPRDGKPLTFFFNPGERFSYSGAGMVLLQKAVEKITGKPLNDYMQEAVFSPLGMKHSSYVWKPEFETETAIGHNVDGTVAKLFKAQEANAAASLTTTVDDYATFLDAVLGKKGLKPATFEEMEKPEIAVDAGCENCVDTAPTGVLSTSIFWGLGVGIEKIEKGEYLWHWGDNGVFKAFFMVQPAKKSGVVYFANSESGLAVARPILSDALGEGKPILDWLKYDNYDSPSFMFLVTAQEQGAAKSIAQFSSEIASGAISENALNNLGYSLLANKKVAEAIVVFQKNVDVHPASWNAYDSLGEAYMDDGQKDAAIKNYEKSLQLKPDSENGKAMLQKLRGSDAVAGSAPTNP